MPTLLDEDLPPDIVNEGEGETIAVFRPRQAAGSAEVVGSDQAVPLVELILYDLKQPQDLPARDWIIPRLVLRGHITLLLAATGIGKSTFALTLALHAAAGRSYGNFKIRRPFTVAFLTCEEDDVELARRLAAAAAYFKIGRADIAGRFFAIRIDGATTLAHADRKGKIHPTPALGALKQALEEHAVDLIVIDPFVEVWDGEENDNMQVRAAGALMRKLARDIGAGLLLTHHVRKGTVSPGDIDAGRGASALGGLVRFAVTMTRMTEEVALSLGLPSDQAKGKIRIDRAKGSYLPEASQADWFAFETTYLGNAAEIEPLGDSVGVLVPWNPPGLFGDVSVPRINAVLDRIARGPVDAEGQPTGALYSHHRQAVRWVGHILVEELDWPEEQAAAAVKVWIREGLLYECDYTDAKSRPAKGLKVDVSKRTGNAVEADDTSPDRQTRPGETRETSASRVSGSLKEKWDPGRTPGSPGMTGDDPGRSRVLRTAADPMPNGFR